MKSEAFSFSFYNSFNFFEKNLIFTVNRPKFHCLKIFRFVWIWVYLFCKCCLVQTSIILLFHFSRYCIVKQINFRLARTRLVSALIGYLNKHLRFSYLFFQFSQSFSMNFSIFLEETALSIFLGFMIAFHKDRYKSEGLFTEISGDYIS